ncbi:MAG TPA: hypothetical protein PK711_06120 [Bacteroidales bacterium]|nr:hypothetical protein [Bacteroidales bacterium]
MADDAHVGAGDQEGDDRDAHHDGKIGGELPQADVGQVEVEADDVGHHQGDDHNEDVGGQHQVARHKAVRKMDQEALDHGAIISNAPALRISRAVKIQKEYPTYEHSKWK